MSQSAAIGAVVYFEKRHRKLRGKTLSNFLIFVTKIKSLSQNGEYYCEQFLKDLHIIKKVV